MGNVLFASLKSRRIASCVVPVYLTFCNTIAIIMPASNKKTHGGKRPGSGRPLRHGERMEQKTVRLPPSWITQLLLDFPSLQIAIETLVERYLKR